MSGSARPAGVHVKLVLVALAWGGTFIGARILTAEMAPVTAAFWRYVVASAMLVAVAFTLEGGLPRLDRRQWVGVALLGATGVAAFNLMFMFGLETVAASRGSLIVALNPAVTLLGAALFLREPLTRNKAIGIVVALCGVSVVLGHGDPRNVLLGTVGVGELALVGCVLAWATYTLLGKRILQGLSPIAATTYAALIGTTLLGVAAAASGHLALPPASWRITLALGFVGVFGSALAFVWFYEGVRALGPARAAVFINLVPVAAIALGVLLLGEPLELSMLAGGAMVIGGIWLINRPQRASAAPVAAAG
jgi:drug/metabolite transporter (DMT)-like permease